ncbi:MAG: acetyl-CoA C-acyltransferase [Actinomycetota bacterium]|nr:acetyl-CoA C-acyltransferase [Actinomycetota bacterium]
MATIISSIARTPMGRFRGGFTPFTAMDLGGFAIAAALDRAGLTGDQIDEVLYGHVIQTGQGQVTGRQAAFKGGIPMTVPSTTIDKACLSGTATIADADMHIKAGESRVIMTGGMESMTNAPHLLKGARFGYGYGGTDLIDSLNRDGLMCAFDDVLMGLSTDKHNALLEIGRAEQDAWSVASHERAIAATESGAFDDEIIPVEVPQRRGDPILIEHDEGMRPGTTVESLGNLRPAFMDDGTVTAGNASQISDGAAALVVADRDAAEELGMPVVAELIAYGQTAGPDTSLQAQPANAMRIALAKAGLEASDLDLVEINEAFASVSLYSADLLGIPHDRVNVNGGAIALGHPLGASGARIVVTLISALRARGGGIGGAALCGGGGQGDALIVRV